MTTYTLTDKIMALDALAALDGDIATCSAQNNIAKKTLRRWQREENQLRAAYAQQAIARVQQRLADKALLLVDAIDDEMIAKAPLNQITSALGALIDRYMKLDEITTQNSPQEEIEKVVRIEYVYDGSTHMAPPWANPDYAGRSAFQSGGMRAAVRQNGTGKDPAAGKIVVPWDANLVASPHVSDGKPGLARSEDEPDTFYDDDDEPRREWAD